MNAKYFKRTMPDVLKCIDRRLYLDHSLFSEIAYERMIIKTYYLYYVSCIADTFMK